MSPKGDPPGFIEVLDDKTLAIPDRLGNKRLRTFENLLVHPDTLRISGRGMVVLDSQLRERNSVNGAMLVVTVPTLAEAMVEHGRLAETVPEMQAIIEKDAAERLY